MKKILNLFGKEEKYIPIELVTDIPKCHLKKNIIENVNSAIGVLGPPGAGKSSLCNAYYKIRFGMNIEYFEMSNSPVSFTKGIWILKEEERMKIKENIDRDILDVEGFQVDDIKSWKYIMVISFICSEIIILNRNSRLDDTKKVLNIIKNSLMKMRDSNIPKILKRIYIQIDDEDEIDNFNDILSQIGYNPNSIESVTIKPLYLPTFDKKRLKQNGNNILNVSDYLKDVEKAFNCLTSTKNEQSISTFIKYIDSLNTALDGKMNFDAQGIIKDLKNEYDVCYETWYNKKKRELLGEDLSDIEDLDETYDSFIDRQNLDFSFSENLEELTFFGSSDEFDKYYKDFGKSKDFKVNKDIFCDVYETKRNLKQIEIDKLGTKKEQKLGELGLYFMKMKNKINQYFGSLKFYDSIDDKYVHCNMNIPTDLDDEKNDFLEKLYLYYERKKKEKKDEWKSQIKRAKYKQKCQCRGVLKCKNGHELDGESVNCGDNCKGKLYWVDGPTHYCICEKCNNISQLNSTICQECNAETLCVPKFTDYIP